MNYINACRLCSWLLSIWKKDGTGEKIELPYRCGSWRHEGDCRLWKGSQDFVRIKEAIESRGDWCHVTITYLQPTKKPRPEDFRNGFIFWSRLRKRLVREYGQIKYIQTWERHRSGWPHVHLAISNSVIFQNAMQTDRMNWENLFMRHAQDVGFGYVGDCSRLYNAATMAGYLTKLARELTGGGKDYQIPVNAPKNFRRLRASVRLLPPVNKSGDYTGELLKILDSGEIVSLRDSAPEKAEKERPAMDGRPSSVPRQSLPDQSIVKCLTPTCQYME